MRLLSSAPTAPARLLSADAIRDVCARPAALVALGEAIPDGAVGSNADRRQAVTDGVSRALALALALQRGDAPGRLDLLLLEEAERRLWEPLSRERTQLLRQTGPDGLFAFLVVDGATRREAWRADTQRRRGERTAPLPEQAPVDAERDPVDLARFRLDVERAVHSTARRTGLSEEVAYGLLVSELSYVEAGRRSGRTANSVWMAIARLRPEWQGLAARGRDAGLGGGILVRVTDRADVAVRRAIRWRLIGGTTAALLLAGTLGAAMAASWLAGGTPTARPPVDAAVEASTPAGEGPLGPAGRLLALEAAAQLLGAGSRVPASARVENGVRRVPEAVAVGGAAGDPGRRADVPSTPAAASCGLGSAALSCR